MAPLTALSLFSGAGGLDLGLERAGFDIPTQVENWSPAQAVLKARFPRSEIHGDIADFQTADRPTLIAAGFPCVDISQVGTRHGLDGPRSGLVSHVFRLAEVLQPDWMLLENVANLLRVQKGRAMGVLTNALSDLGYDWAYRTVDARFTGLPQKRRRVLLLASRDERARPSLLGQVGVTESAVVPSVPSTYGFYWTEGRSGLGLVPNAIPTIKAGSTIGLKSAPAVYLPRARLGSQFVLPSITALEVLQGLPSGWTLVDGVVQDAVRNRLVGNAVPVPIGEWVGRRILDSSPDGPPIAASAWKGGVWPPAAFSQGGAVYSAHVTEFPEAPSARISLDEVVSAHGSAALSARATSGFLRRAGQSTSRQAGIIVAALEAHIRALESEQSAETRPRRERAA